MSILISLDVVNKMDMMAHKAGAFTTPACKALACLCTEGHYQALPWGVAVRVGVFCCPSCLPPCSLLSCVVTFFHSILYAPRLIFLKQIIASVLRNLSCFLTAYGIKSNSSASQHSGCSVVCLRPDHLLRAQQSPFWPFPLAQATQVGSTSRSVPVLVLHNSQWGQPLTLM